MTIPEKIFNFICVSVGLHTRVCLALQGSQRVRGLLELQLLTDINHPWVLGINPVLCRSS